MSISKKIKLISFALVSFIGMMAFADIMFAQELHEKILGQLDAGKTSAGYTTAVDPQVTVAAVIKIFLGFVGSFFIVLIAMASYWYIIARGRTEKIEKATTTIRGAIIGLIIVVLSYAITSFVASGVQKSLKAPEASSRFDCLNTEEGCL